jgi:hypothetical protein
MYRELGLIVSYSILTIYKVFIVSYGVIKWLYTSVSLDHFLPFQNFQHSDARFNGHHSCQGTHG